MKILKYFPLRLNSSAAPEDKSRTSLGKKKALEMLFKCFFGDCWGGRIRTYECRIQSPEPCRLATPQ
jgi:hypothetical protein